MPPAEAGFCRPQRARGARLGCSVRLLGDVDSWDSRVVNAAATARDWWHRLGVSPRSARGSDGVQTPHQIGRQTPLAGSVQTGSVLSVGRATPVQPSESGAPAVAENGLAFPHNGPARALVTSHVADHCELPFGLARTKIRSPSLVATFLGWTSRPALGWPVSAASPASSIAIAIAKVGFGRGCSRPNHRLSQTGIRPSGEPDSGGSQPAP